MKIPEPKKSLNSYARYSSMAIQMMVVIVLGVFGGYHLDRWLNTTPILTVVLSLVSVVTAIYLMTRDLLRNRDKK